MATFSEIIYDVREGLNLLVDDSSIDNRYIKYLWNLKRSKYIRQDLNNLQQTIDNSIIQEFCMELEEVSASNCNIDYDCGTIMRTKLQIPRPLDLHLKSAIISVKPTGKTALPFNFMSKERAIYSKYSQFNKSIYAFIDADFYIYLLSTSVAVKLIECISIRGVFEDPTQLAEFKTCCGCETPAPCFNEDTTTYPIQAHHIDPIRAEILQTLVNTMKAPEDNNNDAKDE